MNIALYSGFPEDAGSGKCGMVFHLSHGCTAGDILALQLHAKTPNKPKAVLQPPVHPLQKVRGDALVNKVVVEPEQLRFCSAGWHLGGKIDMGTNLVCLKYN